MSSGQSGTSTVTSNSAPWSGQQPFLQTGFQQAQNLLNQGPQQYFPNSTVTPFSNQTEQALGGIEQRATDPNSLIGGAQRQLGQTINGDYLNAGNPYFQNMVDRAMNAIQPRISAQFAGGGRYGSGAHAQALASAGADTAGQLAFQNYGQERQNQLSALNFAPQLQNADLQLLGGVGAAREGKAGETIQDQVNRYNFNQNAPDDALRRYMTLVGSGSYGTTQQSQQPLYSNPFATGLGAAASGAAILGNLFGRNGVWGGTG